MASEHWLFAGGVFTAGFAIFHLTFWRLFDWAGELPRLGVINRAVMQVLNLCLTIVFILVAWISFAHAGELVTTALGRTLLAGIAILWGARALMQIVFFGLRAPASVAFFVLFCVGTLLYAIPLTTTG